MYCLFDVLSALEILTPNKCDPQVKWKSLVGNAESDTRTLHCMSKINTSADSVIEQKRKTRPTKTQNNE